MKLWAPDSSMATYDLILAVQHMVTTTHYVIIVIIIIVNK